MVNEVVIIRTKGSSYSQSRVKKQLEKLGLTVTFEGADLATFVTSQSEANKINKVLNDNDAFVVNHTPVTYSLEEWLKKWL